MAHPILKPSRWYLFYFLKKWWLKHLGWNEAGDVFVWLELFTVD
jgi:hypothetical protein